MGSHRKINYRRIVLVGILVSQVLSYSLLWLRMITTPSERTGADFIAFYAAGRVAQSAGGARVYEPGLQQAVQAEQVGSTLAPGQVLIYNHVPYLIPLLVLLVGPDYVASFARWVLLLLLLFVGGTVLVAGLMRQAGWARSDVFWSAAGMLAFFPLFVSLMNGQDTAFAALGLCLWLYGLLTRRDALAGLGLALVTVRPQIAFFLAVPFLFRRRAVFGWFCLGSAALGLASLVNLGPGGLRGFLDLLLVSAGGEWYGLKEPLMVDLIGLLWRTVPGLGAAAIRWIGWGGYMLALAGLCLLWLRSREIGERQIALAVTLAVFFSPHLHYHDLTLLLVPLVAVLLWLVRGGLLTSGQAGPVPLAISLLLLFSGSLTVLKLNLPYPLMAMLILAAYRPRVLGLARRPSTPTGAP